LIFAAEQTWHYDVTVNCTFIKLGGIIMDFVNDFDVIIHEVSLAERGGKA